MSLDSLDRILQALGVGMILVEIVKSFSQALQGKQSNADKKTGDETELSRLLLDINQKRFENAILELQATKAKLDQIEERLTIQYRENVHLRHLLGLGTNDPVTATIDDLRPRPPSSS